MICHNGGRYQVDGVLPRLKAPKAVWFGSIGRCQEPHKADEPQSILDSGNAYFQLRRLAQALSPMTAWMHVVKVTVRGLDTKRGGEAWSLHAYIKECNGCIFDWGNTQTFLTLLYSTYCVICSLQSRLSHCQYAIAQRDRSGSFGE
jgi:hypothetical protein